MDRSSKRYENYEKTEVDGGGAVMEDESGLPVSQLPSRGGKWDGSNLPEGWDRFSDEVLDAALKAANRAVIEGKTEAKAVEEGLAAAKAYADERGISENKV